MQSIEEQNKKIVTRFNKECIEAGDMNSFKELLSACVINHAAPAGTPPGRGSMIYFITEVLRKGFPSIHVEILDQIAEGDKVTTRKILHAVHEGEFMGISPTHKNVAIKVIDIIRVKDGQYAEHWGMSNLTEVCEELRHSNT